MAAEPEALPSTARHVDLGLLRLCGVELAVPVDWVREVVPCPQLLGPCFGTHPALIGSIGVRGDVIPVVDVSALLGFAETRGSGGTVAVLRRDGALLGLRIDSVSGLQRIPIGAVRELFEVDSAARLVDRAFVRDHGLVGILNPALLFEMPGLPLVRSASLAADSAAQGRVQAFVLVTVSGVQIAIDTQLVESTAPATSLHRCEVPAPGWSRSIRYLGREVRVFDQLETLGLDGATSDESHGPVIILRIAPEKFVGWHVDAVRSVARIPMDQLGPLPAGLAARRTSFAGIAADPANGQNLVLDSESVRRSPSIAAMAALCRPITGGSNGSGSLVRESGSAAAFLIFDTGKRLLAAPLDTIREVVPFAGLSSRVEDSEGLCGISDHRGSPVSVYSVDPEVSVENARLLIVADDEGRGPRGFLAQRLATIVNAAACPVPGGSAGAQFIPATVDGQAHSIRIHMLG